MSSDNERDTRSLPPNGTNGDLFKWSGDGNGNGTGKNGAPNDQRDVFKYDGSGQHASTDDTGGQNDHVPANWHPDYSLSSPSAQEWFKESQALRKQKLDLDQNGDHVVQHGDSLWTIAQRELHDHGKQASNQEIEGEITRIAKLNEKSHPSLITKPDFIGDGWKLHIERRDAGNTSSDGGQKGDRCVPKPSQGEVTPPGYKTNPSVIVNNVYTDNAYFDQRSGRGSGGGRPDQCVANRGDDVFRYSGDRSNQGQTQGQGDGSGRDVYQYSGDQSRGRQGQGSGDVYQYSGDQSRGRQGQGSGDVYQYSGDQNRGGQNQGNGDVFQYSGDQGQPRNNTPFAGTGDDGTSFYPGAGSAADQMWDRPGRPGRVIVNNVYAENAYFNQSGGNFQPSPNCRMMQGDPSQSGADNYYNCKTRNPNQGRIIPMNDQTGNGSYVTSDGSNPSYQTSDPSNQSGTGRTDYFTYNGQPRGNQPGDYYSNARSQQGNYVDGSPSTYRNPSGNDDEFAY